MGIDSPSNAWLPALTALILLTAAVAADEPALAAPPAKINLNGEGVQTQRVDTTALATLPQHTARAQARQVGRLQPP